VSTATLITLWRNNVRIFYEQFSVPENGQQIVYNTSCVDDFGDVVDLNPTDDIAMMIEHHWHGVKSINVRRDALYYGCVSFVCDDYHEGLSLA
jgi:hypothetical protein